MFAKMGSRVTHCSLKVSIQTRTALNLESFSAYLPVAGTTGANNHVQFLAVLGTEPGFCGHQASTLPAKPHPAICNSLGPLLSQGLPFNPVSAVKAIFQTCKPVMFLHARNLPLAPYCTQNKPKWILWSRRPR